MGKFGQNVESLNIFVENKLYKTNDKSNIIARLGNFQFLVSSEAFFQVNLGQTVKLYNKVLDFDIIYKLKCNEIKINLPEEIVNPICYSKKQLQQIYYEVLCNELSFEELKPIEKQLYSIFTRINFTPKIQTIIRKIIELNKYTDIGFIQDELLDLLLYLQCDRTKFSSISSIIDLIVNLYAIGYNNFENFDSKIVLEMDLKRIKRAIFSILISKSDAYFINRLSKYNCILAQIIKELKKIDFTYENRILRDIILNMSVYVYFKPEIINNKFDFIPEVYKYLEDNQEKVINMLNYTVNSTADFDDNFVNYFTNSNKLLIHLYDEKYNNNNNNNKKLNKTK